MKQIHLPALRCSMGDWIYYVTCMRFSDINERISTADEIHTSTSLNEMIQRTVQDRSKAISNYLIEQPQRFFNSIIVGVYGGDPEWIDLQLISSEQLSGVDIDEASCDNIDRTLGLLQLTGSEELFPIDGQHRVVAIREALASGKKIGMNLEDEEVSIIFVSHKRDENGLRRTRRLFSTLNRYAKPVSPGEIICLDEDDAFAIVTRKLLDEHPLLKGARSSPAKSRNIPQSDKKSFALILNVYDVALILNVARENNWSKHKLTTIRPSDEIISSVFEESKAFWDGLVNHFLSVKEVQDNDPSNVIAGKYRHPEGGHLLFRPIGLIAFARAVRQLRDAGTTMDEVFRRLSVLPYELSQLPWRGLLWNPVKKTMEISAARTEIATLMLLYYTGSVELEPILAEKYKRLFGDADANLPNLQTNGEAS